VFQDTLVKKDGKIGIRFKLRSKLLSRINVVTGWCCAWFVRVYF